VVGIYSAAYGLVAAPFALVVGSMAQFLYPIMFRASAIGSQKSKMNAMKVMLITSTVICSLGVIIVALLNEQMAWIGLGEQYREDAQKLFVWIALGYGCLGVSMSFGLAAQAEKRTLDLLIAYGTSAVVNVSLNILLIPELGAFGAVIATVFALVVHLGAMATLFKLSRGPIQHARPIKTE